MAVKGLRGFIRKENKMADITLTQRELDEIKDEERFKEKTTLLLKRIEEHQKKQNGSIEDTMKKVASNTTSVKIYWGLFAILFTLVAVIFRIK